MIQVELELQTIFESKITPTQVEEISFLFATAGKAYLPAADTLIKSFSISGHADQAEYGQDIIMRCSYNTGSNLHNVIGRFGGDCNITVSLSKRRYNVRITSLIRIVGETIIAESSSVTQFLLGSGADRVE